MPQLEIQKSLGYLLNTSARLIKRRLDAQLSSYRLTTSQWAVLQILSIDNDLSQAEIAEKTSTDRATCGAVIEKLIEKHMVQKALSENDRRSYIVSITQEGLNALGSVTYLAEEINAFALEGLTDYDVDNLIRCLMIINNNLSNGEKC